MNRKKVMARTDRTWALPNEPWVMRMTWSDLLFAHWPVEPHVVTSLLPAAVTLDTRDGMAWVGVVPFTMSNVAPRWCPPIPGLSHFLELNVRTYVIVGGKPGVWFFSLDAASRVAVRVARATFNLPYMDAKMAIDRRSRGEIEYVSQRTHRAAPPANYHAVYSASGACFEAQPGSLEFWLTARYCLYSADRRGRIYRGEIDHSPWSLAPATCTEQKNTMCDPLGVEFNQKPHLLFAKPVDVRAWRARQLTFQQHE